MILRLHGTVHGNRIELDRDPGLPPGSGVNVQIEPTKDSNQERKKQLLALAGVWKDDPSMEAIFASIRCERNSRGYRDIDFDASSR
jgi:hypothetical protein